jgi:hypothetical protein
MYDFTSLTAGQIIVVAWWSCSDNKP